MPRRIVTSLLLLLLGIFVALIFALPAIIAIVFLLFCFWLWWKKKNAELLMMLCSLLFMFGVIEIFVRFTADDLFYREHERWALKTRYRANVLSTLQVRFGDMVAMDPTLKEPLAEPHSMEFKTDDAGYRNAGDYNNEPFIILGDSFATTIGNSQENILVSQLNNSMPQQFYSRGFPGAPKDYEMSALIFSKEHPKARYVWFIFEGNDLFIPGEGAEAPRLPTAKDQYQNYTGLRALPFMATRVMSLMQKTAKARWQGGKKENSPSPVSVFNIAGTPVGFLNRYIEHAAAPTLELRILGTADIMSRTACVFFIPDKYRVYKPWIKDGSAISEPAAGLAALQKTFAPHHIPVVDLTPSLQKAAAEKIKNSRFVFWRDDTHWNGDGIASIVGDVEKCVKQGQPVIPAKAGI